MKNESVVLGERERIGGEFVQRGIFEPQRRLHVAALLLLAEDVGDVIGAESARGVRFGNRGRHGFGAVFANKREEFAHLAGQGTVGVGETLQISWEAGPSRATRRC